VLQGREMGDGKREAAKTKVVLSTAVVNGGAGQRNKTLTSNNPSWPVPGGTQSGWVNQLLKATMMRSRSP